MIHPSRPIPSRSTRTSSTRSRQTRSSTQAQFFCPDGLQPVRGGYRVWFEEHTGAFPSAAARPSSWPSTEPRAALSQLARG